MKNKGKKLEIIVEPIISSVMKKIEKFKCINNNFNFLKLLNKLKLSVS